MEMEPAEPHVPAPKTIVVARVEQIVEGSVIARAVGDVVDINTPVFHGGERVGTVVDIFGRVNQPYYRVDGAAEVGWELSVSELHVSFVDMARVDQKGTDKTDANDLEASEPEFSDDEEERRWKKSKKLQKQKQRAAQD